MGRNGESKKDKMALFAIAIAGFYLALLMMSPMLSNTNDQMEELASICPVGAIDAKRCKIIKKKCIKVRCLKCYRESEPGRIILKGFGRPKGRA